ncbi:uncharacterized protein [Macaca fascicularis]|uniref:uncharacterized protein n=1 Tax=Macaca fascicularis TaxID=9541 RepID=UPI003D1596DA
MQKPDILKMGPVPAQAPPGPGYPCAGRAQDRLPASLRPIPRPARPPGFGSPRDPALAPDPCLGPGPATLSQPLAASAPRRLGPAPHSGHSAVIGWFHPPDAGAAQPIGGCHTAARAGLGGWDLRLQVRLGQTRERRQPECGRAPDLRSPSSAATLPAASTPPRRHAPSPPCAIPGRGAASRRGPPRRCLRCVRTHGRQLRESRLRHGLCGPHARGVLRPLMRPLCRDGGRRAGLGRGRGRGELLGLRSAGALHSCGPLLRRAHFSLPGAGGASPRAGESVLIGRRKTRRLRARRASSSP